MRIPTLHSWALTPREAIRLQKRLAPSVTLKRLPRKLTLVAGADVAFSANSDTAFAAVVVLSLDNLVEIEHSVVHGSVSFPYVPGLLTFREGPLLVKALRKLRTTPDVILFDGQGIAHSRGMGVASHMGLLAGLPTVGCAKSPLLKPVRTPGRSRGCRAQIVRDERTVGFAVRTRTGVRPVYVSPGHLSDLQSSVRLVLECCRKYRLPEPLRAAHALCTRAARQE